MKDIAVIIPTKLQSDLLIPLLETIAADKRVALVLVVYDDKWESFYTRGSPRPNTIGIETSSHTTVYQKWNRGVEFLANGMLVYLENITNIAVLNDDVIIDKHTLSTLANWLRYEDQTAVVYPDYTAFHDTYDYKLRYTTSTFGAGGMAGFCFMFKRELFSTAPFDENFELYWGDDDFVKQVEAKGYKIARVEGLPITHGGSHTISKMDPRVRDAMMNKDREYFYQKYGERREPVY